MDMLLSARPEVRCLFGASDPEIRRARQSTALALIVSNAAGAALTFAIGALAYPVNVLTTRALAILGIGTGAYLLVTLAMGTVQTLRLEARTEAILTSVAQREPEELRHVLGNQWRYTRRLGVYWLGAALLVALIEALVLQLDALLIARDVVTVLLGGLTTSAIAFLIIERGMRPVVTRLREALPDVVACAPSVRARLVLAWLLGSGIPLLGIVITLLQEQDADRTRLFILLGLLAAIGIGVGAATSFLAAGSVADPLRSLHTTMQRVGDGDLQATVPIADSGEIGDLQARFNKMTAGLREREQLRQLFGRHVGEDVARYAMERTTLGGETRDVSVLFVDLRGSTALAEHMPAQSVVSLLNDLFTSVVENVEAEGGWANKFEGDAALCIFGAPLPQPDHAARALCAARRLSQALAQLRRRQPGLDAGIGVATGTVVAGNIGTEHRYEYTVIGDPVNVAARLCDLAKTVPGRVLVDADSVQAAGDQEAAAWQSRGEVELRGRRQRTLAYAPADIESRASRAS